MFVLITSCFGIKPFWDFLFTARFFIYFEIFYLFQDFLLFGIFFNISRFFKFRFGDVFNILRFFKYFWISFIYFKIFFIFVIFFYLHIFYLFWDIFRAWHPSASIVTYICVRNVSLKLIVLEPELSC